MRAWIFHGPGDLRLEDVERASGARQCGGVDQGRRHVRHRPEELPRGHPTLFPELPARFGHEFTGVVSEVGEGVDQFAVGQRVVAANTCPCGACWACQIGRSRCAKTSSTWSRAFAEQIVIPDAIVERNTYAIPDSLPLRAAAARAAGVRRARRPTTPASRSATRSS